MTSHTTQNDPIEKILNNIIEEVEKETRPVQYANFLQRVIARLVDTLIIVGISYGIQFIAFYFIRNDNIYNAEYIMSSLNQALPALAIMLWVLLYSPVMEATGGTVGKRLMKIQLVDDESMKVPPFRSFVLRSWAYLVFIVLAVLPAILSCLAYFVSDKKQTWHDKLGSVICIKK